MRELCDRGVRRAGEAKHTGERICEREGWLEARFEAPRMLACVLLHPRRGIVCR